MHDLAFSFRTLCPAALEPAPPVLSPAGRWIRG